MYFHLPHCSSYSSALRPHFPKGLVSSHSFWASSNSLPKITLYLKAKSLPNGQPIPQYLIINPLFPGKAHDLGVMSTDWTTQSGQKCRTWNKRMNQKEERQQDYAGLVSTATCYRWLWNPPVKLTARLCSWRKTWMGADGHDGDSKLEFLELPLLWTVAQRQSLRCACRCWASFLVA